MISDNVTDPGHDVPELSGEEVLSALHEHLQRKDAAALEAWIEELPPGQITRAVSRLSEEEQLELFALMAPEVAADLIDDLPDEQSADLLENMPADQAAAIVEELDSDDRADVLGEMEEEDVEAILDAMQAEEAQEARQLMSYASDTAGGVMVKEYVAYRMGTTVEEVLDDLRLHYDEYSDYDVRYFYVTDAAGVLRGMLRLRDLVLSSPERDIAQIMIPDPTRVTVDEALVMLQRLFETHRYSALPVTDGDGLLLGVVIEKEVAEAARKHASRTLLKLGGIFGGEELRTMPLVERVWRRLLWLVLIMFLMLLAASVIHFFEETLVQAIALTMFLPVVAGMSGSSGNQAMALSLREISLGAVDPWDLAYVFTKEIKVGLINGMILGGLLAILGYLWKRDICLGLIVGSALAVNTILMVCIGGMLPLLAKRLGVDPAATSGPILTTVADTSGFFMVLGIAWWLL